MIPDAAGHFLQNMLAPPAEPGPPYTHTVSLRLPSAGPEAVEWLRGEIESDPGIARHILDVRGSRPDARHPEVPPAR